jgi:hypothetical protein
MLGDLAFVAKHNTPCQFLHLVTAKHNTPRQSPHFVIARRAALWKPGVCSNGFRRCLQPFEDIGFPAFHVLPKMAEIHW